MKYCVEIKQADQPAKAYWHTKEFNTKDEAIAYMELQQKAAAQYGQSRDWNYRVARISKGEEVAA